jgi:membrane protease YdiL (CAAX protease family)
LTATERVRIKALRTAFLYEALPEELTLRGYAYRNLNATLRRWTASLVVVLLFLMVPAFSSLFAAAIGVNRQCVGRRK